MICRNCGTEIADKAIVCYRCGAATTDPVRKPVDVRRKRSPLPVIIVILLFLLAALWAARRYHVLFGLELPAYSTYSTAVLIDSAAGKCLTPV
jgi:hypothetical protein